jgi:hypothetical protein
MDPQLIKNVLSLPIMILMVLVFLIVIAVSITNTIYYKKLWEENGSESISEESAKVFFFINLFVAIISGLVFFIFAYRWYKLYNITNMELASKPTFMSPMRPQMASPVPTMTPYNMTSPIVSDRSATKPKDISSGYPDAEVAAVLDFDTY